MQILKFVRTHPDAQTPTRAKHGDSGLDLYALRDTRIDALGATLVETGIAIELEHGFEGQVRPRSGLTKRGIMAALGTIDSGYRGQILVAMYTLCGVEVVRRGDRVAQLVVAPVCYPGMMEEFVLSLSERNDGGFGSSGR